MVDVFGVGTRFFEPCGIVLRALGDFLECGERLFHFRGRENADGLESFGPGAVDGDFVGKQAPVERKGTLKGVEALVGFTFEAAAPEFGVFAIGHGFSRCGARREIPRSEDSARNEGPRYFPPLWLWGER